MKVIAYHGTTANFDAFRNDIAYGEPTFIWFADSKEICNSYADGFGDEDSIIYTAEIELGNCLDLTSCVLANRFGRISINGGKVKILSLTDDAKKLFKACGIRLTKDAEKLLTDIFNGTLYDLHDLDELYLFDIVKTPEFTAFLSGYDSVKCTDLTPNNVKTTTYGIRDPKNIDILKKTTKHNNRLIGEKLDVPQLNEIDKFIEELYDLRKTSIATDGEYGIGNLVFKELRNRGCLDKLKDLKHEIASKELSLENLHESQSQEIGDYYAKLSKLYGIDLEDLVYGPDGFMKNCYPDGFPDFAGDVIYSEEHWNEFEGWLRNMKGIELKQLDSASSDDYDEFEEDYKQLTSAEMQEYRIKIGRAAAGAQAIVDRNGMFQIHNVQENDAAYVVSALRRLDFIAEVHAAPSGKFDFRRMSGAMPARYQTITGRIKLA